jgi:Transposase DDE domain group 1
MVPLALSAIFLHHKGMRPEKPASFPHPQGEPFLPPAAPCAPWPVDTPGGRFYAEWDRQEPVTKEGQLIFFAQFLKASGLWERLLADCPLAYHGNRGSSPRDVIGTLMLSVLAGHWRYAHIASIRGDGVNPGLLGMTKTVSEDTVRDALKRLDTPAAAEWLHRHLLSCIQPLLALPWILDMDTTVKPLYGHQQGAEIGYNPVKPGRPSLINHSYFVANLRLCLGTDVQPGKATAARHSSPGLWKLLESLPRTHWPTLLRADCHYGHEAFMADCETRGLPYLFKLRHSPHVKTLVRDSMRQGSRWQSAGPGWETMHTMLRLKAWSRPRRVVLVREAPALAPVGENKRRRRDHQSDLPGTDTADWQPTAAPWSGKIAVLVTSLDAVDFPAASIARLYHERGDMENCYDELKNQWGWNGYVTQRLGPTRLMSQLVALFYNWWHLYTRLHDAGHHREAITSRPALMTAVARQTQSGGRRTVRIGRLHAKASAIVELVTLVSNYLREFSRIAEGWTWQERWETLLTRIWRHWLGGKWLSGVPPSAVPLLTG